MVGPAEVVPPAPAVVHVSDFGAVGDGVTDDTKAITAAINGGHRAAQRRRRWWHLRKPRPRPAVVVFGQSGTYQVSATIKFPAPSTD